MGNPGIRRKKMGVAAGRGKCLKRGQIAAIYSMRAQSGLGQIGFLEQKLLI